MSIPRSKQGNIQRRELVDIQQPVRLNIALFLEVVGVAIAVTTGYTVATISATGSLDPVPTLVVALILAGTCIYGISLFLEQVIRAWKNRDTANDLDTSAFLGGLIFGLLGFFLSSHSSFFSGVSIIVCGLSSVGLLLCIMRGTTEETGGEASAVRQDQVSGSALPMPLSGDLQAIGGPGKVEASLSHSQVHRVDPTTLPPLFAQDRWHQLPQTHQSTFLNVTKHNEHQVYGEDACAISEDETRFALCDGASASSIPRPWGAMLAFQWLNNPLCEPDINSEMLRQWLAEPLSRWKQWVQTVWWTEVNKRNQLTGDHPVSPLEVEQVLSRGADATFLGVMLDRPRKRWYATTIGDTCLFHIKRHKKTSWYMHSFIPVSASVDFTQTPPLLSTRMENRRDSISSPIKCYEDRYQSGEFLLMATDALAQWLIFQNEQGLSEWQGLLTMRDPQDFARFVAQEREHNLMEEDDTTLVIIPL